MPDLPQLLLTTTRRPIRRFALPRVLDSRCRFRRARRASGGARALLSPTTAPKLGYPVAIPLPQERIVVFLYQHSLLICEYWRQGPLVLPPRTAPRVIICRAMSPEQVIAELRCIRFCPSLRSVARAAGLHTETLYRAIRSGKLSEANKTRLERVFRFNATSPSHIRRSLDPEAD